jgi:hypothetical protein
VRLTDSAGKTAPSFIATIAILVLLAVGYVAWTILSPNPIAQSEMVVRDFSKAAAAELGPLRRALRDEVARYKGDPATLASVRNAIDDRAASVRETIETLADEARDRIDLIDGIGLQTQDNRLQRIQSRKADAQARINGLVAEARGQLPAE